MASQDQYKLANEKLIKILSELLATGDDWQASLFLKTAQKKIQGLLDQALVLSEQNKPPKNQKNDHDVGTQLGLMKVFVSIYQSDPFNLIKWENTLKSIKEYSINRPIYRSQNHIEEMIRSKQGSSNEGYVVIFIKPSDIIQPYAGKKIEDRWGHELLTLRDNSLRAENILEFVHLGRRFSFKDGKLLLKSDIR